VSRSISKRCKLVAQGFGLDDGTLQVPQFHDMLVSLQRGSFHTSNAWIPLPPAYTTPPATQQQARGGTGVLLDRQTLPYRASLLPPPVAAVAPAAARGDAATQTFVANPTSDPEFANLTLRPQMRELLRANRRPSMTLAPSSVCPGGEKGAVLATAVGVPPIEILSTQGSAPDS
jgi:hypothetical protein